MRIVYCTNVRLPSERAHGHQIAQVCDALVHSGHDVQVFCPFRHNVVTEDYHTYYGAEKEVQITYVGSYDFIASPLPGVLKLWAMNRMLRAAMPPLLRDGNFDLLYTRTPALLPALLETGKPVVLELHQLPRFGRRSFVRSARRCTLVACLTSAMRDTLVAWGVPMASTIVEGDAVDLSRFENLPSQQSARLALGIRTDRVVVGYVGRLKTLGMEKGVGHLLEALARMKHEKRFFGLIVGGPESDCDEYRSQASQLGLTDADVLFTGEVEAARVPLALAACDVLAMPFPDYPHYRHHMSPLKMFEYMAAHRVILTSDLPTVRDTLSEQTAVFCHPGDVGSIAQALQWIAGHPAEAQKRADAALALVRDRYSWEERMKRVLAPLVP